MRRRLVAATVLAALLALAGAAFFVYDRGGWTTTSDARSGISLERPERWQLQRFGEHCFRGGPGMLVANVRRAFERETIPSGCTSRWNLRDLPPDHVVVDVSGWANPVRGSPADTPLPLDLDRFRISDNRPGYRYQEVVRGRRDYLVFVWLGKAATRADREAVERLVRSIRFTRPADD